MLLSRGERLGWLAVLACAYVKRVQRLRLVDVQEGVVTAGEHGGYIVAETLVGGVIDHTDGAVGSRLEEPAFFLSLRKD